MAGLARLISRRLCFVMCLLHVLEASSLEATLARPVSTPVCGETVCPEECVCQTLTSSGLLVDCSLRNLTTIPASLPAKTEQLLLHHNSIIHLGKTALLGCTHLKYLDLSYSMISVIDKDSLNDSRLLEVLLLQKNYVPPGVIASPFPMDLLQMLSSLTTLDVHKNSLLQNFSSHDFKQLARDNRRLRSLSLTLTTLHANHLSDLFLTLSRLHELEELYLYCDKKTNITGPDFSALSNTRIKKLLMRCLIKEVDSSTFSDLVYLETLDLSYMLSSTADEISQSWPGLRYTNITSLDLVEAFEQTTELKAMFLSPLQFTRLTRLKLDSNLITSIGKPKWFQQYLPHLEYLSLENNRILEPLSIYKLLNVHKNLRFANFNNQVKAIPLSSDSDNEVSKKVCREEPLSRAVLSSPDDCRVFRFPKVDVPLQVPETLEYLWMSSVGSLFVLAPTETVTVYASTNLRYFNYARNNLEEIWGTLVEAIGPKRPVHKIVIDLSDNGCRYIDNWFGERAGNVTGALLLGQNKLGNQLKNDITGQTFGRFVELTELDLSSNQIRTLPEHVFHSQIKLRTLNLTQNNLQFLQFSLKHMARLTVLDLSSNLLRHLSEDNCQDLDSMAAGLNLSVFLAGNPLTCSCDSLHFLQWVVNTRVQFPDEQLTSCLYNGRLVSLSSIESEILPDLNVSCKGNAWLIGSTVGLALTLIALVISVALYRHRFEVRYALLKLAIGRKKYDAVNDRVEYVYDAFVAFDVADVDWVSQNLVPKLEGEDDSEFRLCVHQRDFNGGTPIVENIADAICSSRKVIVVLTRNFLASSWCQFELETAHVRSFEEGKDLIIPVLLEDLPVAKMSKTLRVLLKRNTYIMWPEQEQEIGNFWEALKRALSTTSTRIIRCQCGNNVKL